MITFSIVNLKGGVGKTFIVKHISVFLAAKGARVLVIDNDKQGNLSKFFKASTENTLADLLTGKKDIKKIIQKTHYHHVDIITADMQLMDVNFAILQDDDCKQDTILKDALAIVEEQYDFCIIDNPPDVNLSVFNAWVVANEVIIVTTPDEDAMVGADEMIRQISIAGKYNPDLVFRGCLLNKFIPNSLSYEYKESAEYSFFNTHIHLATRETASKLNQSIEDKVTIFELSPGCMVARDLRKFVNELMYMGG